MAEAALRNFTINFGPQHPAAHGVLRLVLELDGEIVERVDPHIGLLHRGTEKLIEHKTYLQALPYFDRLDYVAPMNQEHAFCLAVEKLLGIAVPRRGQLIRVLYCEIGRLLSHLLNVTTQAMDVGALTPPLWGFEEREKLMVFYERASGARMHANYFRVGGVHQDLPPKLLDDIWAFCDPFLKVCDDIEGLLTENRIFKQRNVDIAEVKLADAGNGAFPASCCAAPAQPGTCASRSPTNVMRRWSSISPLARTATATTAISLRMEEMRQSVRIMKQCLEKLRLPEGRGPGCYQGQQDRSASARRNEALDGGDHPPFQALLAKATACRPARSTPQSRPPKESSASILIADGTNRPYRCKIRAPVIRPSAGDGLLKPRAHACRHLGDHRLARHRVRGDLLRLAI